jgi:hypothetical protein
METHWPLRGMLPLRIPGYLYDWKNGRINN